ncbi:MAG: hypothetical protein H0W33_09300 [Gammaproteobacteria bacterium]|nr:hypothetical protein [Gammaproteobacteria bacterium]
MYEPILSRRLLAEIFDLNLAFTHLLERGDVSMAVSGLGMTLVERIARLPRPALEDLCGCPFPLFGLRFDDLDFWHAVREARPSYKYAVRPAEVRANSEPTQQAFALLALFYAWHLTSTNPIAARLCFGLPPAAARIFRSLPVSELLSVATHSPGLLHAQFDDNPSFWADLMEIVESGDRRRLCAARILGTQLLGAHCAERAGRIRRMAARRRHDRPQG